MIKAAGRTAVGVPLMFLGLSAENIGRLMEGKPIVIRAPELAALGLPQIEVVLHYGKTEQAILDELEAHGMEMRHAQ